MIAFIDCYINSPVYNCVNQFVDVTGIPASYHIPSKFGVDSLKEISNPDCYIILGSAAHVGENSPWQKELLNFIIPKLESGIPVLGICYGHQLIADYFGSEIGYINSNQDHFDEIRTVSITDKDFLSKLALKKNDFNFAFAHSQVIQKLDPCFKSVAKSRLSSNEIIQHKTLPFVGIQAHPEASKSYLQNDLKVGESLPTILEDGQSFIRQFYTSLALKSI